MDRSEQLARRYLESLSLGPVVYEPDGGVPPDFVVAGRIAVEVRRLNQNYETGCGHEGLENAGAAVIRALEKVLPTFGIAPGGAGYWVSVDFWRPLDWPATKRAMRRALQAFKADPQPGITRMQLSPSFELEIRPATIEVANYFMFGASSDRDAGGFVASEIIRNLNLCVAEKARKIAPHRLRYDEWWLILPDYIGPDLNEAERQTIAPYIETGCFERVVLIHPKRPEIGLVIAGERCPNGSDFCS